MAMDPMGNFYGSSDDNFEASPSIEHKTPPPAISPAQAKKNAQETSPVVDTVTTTVSPPKSSEPTNTNYVPSKPGKIRKSNKKNTLNSYRSYSYIFTLAALKSGALLDPNTYRENDDYFVIAKSVGKGTAGIKVPSSLSNLQQSQLTPTQAYEEQPEEYASRSKNTLDRITADVQDMIDSFNKNSPGRFDFYINNVNIDTLMAFNKTTLSTLATKIEFDIYEPYSMTGLLEALQVSAVASGHIQYANCPFLLKVEFVGYPDKDNLPDKAEIVEQSTRYFVFSFAGIDINVTEEGTRYHCKGVPFNERGFGEPSQVKSTIKIEGNTVGEILKSLEDGLNSNKSREAGAEKNPSKKDKHDSYEILFPKVEADGTITKEVNTDLASKKVVELLKDNAVYKFPDPGDLPINYSSQGAYMPRNMGDTGQPSSTNQNSSISSIIGNASGNTLAASAGWNGRKATDPTSIAITFKEGSNIHECIDAIITDSEYVRSIIHDVEKSVDSFGMVDYFIITVETVDKGIFDEATNKPFYIYRYLVLPYKVHYSRIPLLQNKTIDTSKRFLVSTREYNYLYTGNNSELLKFNLNFNHLFFQAIPRGMGNRLGYSADANSMEPPGTSITNLTDTPTSKLQRRSISTPSVRSSVEQNDVLVGGNLNAALTAQSDPYRSLAKNLHQAILDNVDQCTADIEIIGDPFYLVTGGMGNYRPKLANGSYGITTDGEAAYTFGDVLILLTFKNPIDINPKTGEALFNQQIVPYSGLFRVQTVSSHFKDGRFTQDVKLIRIPSQPEDTNDQPEGSKDTIQSTEDPTQTPTTPPPEINNGIRADQGSLAMSVATNSIPTTGLPGTLSRLASGANSLLSSIKLGAITAGSLLNQIAGGTGSPLNGLTGISSAIRLSSAGLLSAPSSAISAGASINQLTSLAGTIGIPNATGLSNSIITSGLASEVNSSVMSTVNNLGSNSANLVSGVGSKISNLNGLPSAFSGQLGIGTNQLSGLSSGLDSKINTQILDAASSIPSGVDISAAVNSGLILDTIPIDSLKNIPVTQPSSVAPPPNIDITDIQYVVGKGGSLSDFPNASSVPGIENLVSSRSIQPLATGFGLDSGSVADKFSTLQSGLSQVTGQGLSIEASLNKVSSSVPSGVPNVASVSSSVATKYGSISQAASSPLDIIMKTAG